MAIYYTTILTAGPREIAGQECTVSEPVTRLRIIYYRRGKTTTKGLVYRFRHRSDEYDAYNIRMHLVVSCSPRFRTIRRISTECIIISRWRGVYIHDNNIVYVAAAFLASPATHPVAAKHQSRIIRSRRTDITMLSVEFRTIRMHRAECV